MWNSNKQVTKGQYVERTSLDTPCCLETLNRFRIQRTKFPINYTRPFLHFSLKFLAGINLLTLHNHYKLKHSSATICDILAAQASSYKMAFSCSLSIPSLPTTTIFLSKKLQGFQLLLAILYNSCGKHRVSSLYWLMSSLTHKDVFFFLSFVLNHLLSL